MAGLPSLFGRPISVSTLPSLTAYRGKLLTGEVCGKGTAVYAASFIRRREIVLEAALFADSQNLGLILVHEIFHFVWPRLGQTTRGEFRTLIDHEINIRARGEMGESAAVHKLALQSASSPASESKWREYVCESFCDTAAWLFANGGAAESWMLAQRWRRERRRWFEEVFSKPRSC